MHAVVAAAAAVDGERNDSVVDVLDCVLARRPQQHASLLEWLCV